jgi:hypothetical protein
VRVALALVSGPVSRYLCHHHNLTSALSLILTSRCQLCSMLRLLEYISSYLQYHNLPVLLPAPHLQPATFLYNTCFACGECIHMPIQSCAHAGLAPAITDQCRSTIPHMLYHISGRCTHCFTGLASWPSCSLQCPQNIDRAAQVVSYRASLGFIDRTSAQPA